jgi:3-phenylpropionate/trans-cinnamate dioxygenase ferredoxin subunit
MLPDGKMMLVVAKGKEILLANVGGTYYAVANKCTHLGGMLSEGKLDGSTVTCPRHGARFDVRSGQNVGDAKIAFIKTKSKNLARFEVKVEGSDILVGIPE